MGEPVFFVIQMADDLATPMGLAHIRINNSGFAIMDPNKEILVVTDAGRKVRWPVIGENVYGRGDVRRRAAS